MLGLPGAVLREGGLDLLGVLVVAGERLRPAVRSRKQKSRRSMRGTGGGMLTGPCYWAFTFWKNTSV